MIPSAPRFDRLARFAGVQQTLDQERPAPLPAQPFDIAPADIRVQLLVHQGAEGADRGPRAIIDKGRGGRLPHPQEPCRMAQKVDQTARTPAQREGHAVARIAVAPRHHLIVDRKNETLVTGRRGAVGEFGGQPAILVQKDLHPFRPRRRGADLFDGRGRGVARAVDRSEPRRRARRGEFGVRPQQARKPSRADDDGRWQLDAEQVDRLIAGCRAGEQGRNEFDCGQRRLVGAHGDLVAGGAVDHVEQHARQLLARQRPQRGDAVAFALEPGLIHQQSSRSLITASMARHRS